MPHWFQQLIANPVRGLPRDWGDPFPSYYRMNTCHEVRRVLARVRFIEEALLTVEAEPSSLMISLPSLRLGAPMSDWSITLSIWQGSVPIWRPRRRRLCSNVLGGGTVRIGGED